MIDLKAEKSAFLSRRKNYKEFRMIGFSLPFCLPDISFTTRKDLIFIFWIIGVLGVLYYICYIFKIIGIPERKEKIWNNIKDNKLLLVAITIIVIVLIYQIIPNLLETVPALIGVGTVVELLSSGCQKTIVNKFNISEHLKENKCVFRLGIFLLLAPFIFLGLFPIMKIPNGIFSPSASDVLGYYGSLVGGAVTVLGVYWTLNYESKKSKEERKREREKEEEARKREREKEKEERKREREKEKEERKRERERFKEERRKDSLPILRFSYSPNSTPVFDGITRETTANKKSIYQIILNTSDESSVHKINENGIERGKADYKTIFPIMESGTLYIKNVGLGAAILSNVDLCRKDTKERVKNLQADTQSRYIIQPNTSLPLKMIICSNNFSKDDVLCVVFRDIYSNKYIYIISFENNFTDEEEKTIINECSVEVLPKQIK